MSKWQLRFPNERNRIRERFAGLLAQTGWASTQSVLRLLCVHQTFEGATVGPVGYTFRYAPDVIPGRAIPHGFAAVLAGHIHRHQVLTADLAGRPLAAPVFYPGSTERTSSAEDGEEKGFVTMELDPQAGRVVRWNFQRLEASRESLPFHRASPSTTNPAQ